MKVMAYYGVKWLLAYFIFLIVITHSQAQEAVDEDYRNRINLLLDSAQAAILINPSDGIRPAKQALFIARNHNDFYNIFRSNLILGDIHNRLSDFEVAVNLYSKAASLATEHQYHSDLIMTYYKLGLVYSYLENTTEAFRFFELSKQAALSEGRHLLAMQAEATKAYTDMYYNKRYLPAYLKSMQAFYDTLMQIPDELPLKIRATNNLAGAYLFIANDVDKAESKYLEALEYAAKSGDLWKEIIIENNLTDLYIQHKKFPKAQKLLNKNLVRSEQLSSKLLIRNTMMLKAKYHESKGEYKEAYYAYDKAYRINQKLLNEKVLRETQEAISLYRIEKAEKESQLLKKTKELLELKAAAEVKFYQILSVFGIGAGLLIFIFYRQQRSQYQKILSQAKIIEEQNNALNELNESLQKGKAELEKAKEDVEKAYKIKSDFLSMVSHEVRTPLNVIMGIAQHLMADNFTEAQKKNLQLLLQSGEHLLFIMNDILDIGKIEAGKMELEINKFSIKTLLQNTYQAFLHKAQEKNLQLTLHITPPDMPDMVMGDYVRLGQILNNLLSNAIKFTDKGNVELSLQFQGKAGNIAQYHIIVHDTGIGIPKDKQSLIFQPFQQVSNTPSSRMGGTGLGLSITKKLVELMDGEISFESEENKGSTFVVKLFLPLAEYIEAPHVPYAAQTMTGHEFKGIKALIVDDLEANIIVLNNFLTKWGFVTDIARSGKEATAKVAQNHYDVILMDLHMPDMDGYQATYTIRNIPGNENTIIIAITASALVVNTHQSHATGLNDYLTKPFKAEDLWNKLNKHLTPTSFDAAMVKTT